MPPPPGPRSNRPSNDDLPPDEEGDDESAEDEEDEEHEEEEQLEGPPEESFDEKYNKHLEFPISLVAAVLIHVVVAATIIFVLTVLLSGEDKSGVPVKLVALDGMDDFGEGSAGSGGVDDPFIKADGNPDKAAENQLNDPTKLPEIEEVEKTIKYIDPTGNLPISKANAAAYADLDKRIRDKLLGQKQGAGPGKGSGYDGSAGTGPGGTGSDSTLGRNMRWVLRFKVSSGRDYLEQLRAMKAEVLVPIPDSENAILIGDLSNPDQKRSATDDDMRRLGKKIKFSDSRPAAVSQVAQTLRLEFRPKSFWAFFPKEIEKELSERELSYRNRRSEDIEETVFSVRVTGGDYKFVVEEQTLKR